MKRLFCFLPILFILCSCQRADRQKHTSAFFGFDTVIQITGYTESLSEFEEASGRAKALLEELNVLFDIYNDYEGINNLKTVNDNAGIKPVKVDGRVIELIEKGIEAYDLTNGAVNIALGPVLRVWHECRETETVPDSALLESLRDLCDIDGVVVDSDAGTVFLRDAGMCLDVGALAKGYAAGLAALELPDGCFIDAGGNVVFKGQPADGRKSWTVGIQHPDNADELITTLNVKFGAAVTSGDYQRYFIDKDGVRYAHIIDPETLFPANRYRSCTVYGEDSLTCDILSTALFILPAAEGKALAESMGYEAVWVNSEFGVPKEVIAYAGLSIASR